MKRRLAVWVAFAAVVAIVGAGRAQAQTLGVGDPAPKISVKRFVKGQPVTAFQPGKNYVVEFWATWCGPCKVSIPHLTELQKKYPAVTFIGVSVFEQDQTKVAPFVTSMGEKMAYRVAMDSVPAGAEADSGAMAKSWMTAAGQEGIPTAFIVDTKGRIAWIGHPMEMAEPLAQVVAGKWDLKAAQEKSKQQQAEKGQLEELGKKLKAAQATGDPKKLLGAIDEALQAKPDLEAQLGYPKLRIMADTGADTDKLNEYGQHLIDVVYKDNPQALNGMAWSIIDPDAKKLEPKLTPFALKAALKADEVTDHKRPDVADTLARAYFLNGDAAKALEIQKRAIEQAKGTPLEKEEGPKKRLEEYQKAAAKP